MNIVSEIVSECKPEFQFKKSSKMRNLDNVYIWWPTSVMSRTDAQNGL